MWTNRGVEETDTVRDLRVGGAAMKREEGDLMLLRLANTKATNRFGIFGLW